MRFFIFIIIIVSLKSYAEESVDLKKVLEIRRFVPFSSVYARFKIPWHNYKWRVMNIDFKDMEVEVDRKYRDIDINLNPHLKSFYEILLKNAVTIDSDNNVILYGIGKTYKRKDILKRESEWDTLRNEFPEIQEARFKKTKGGYTGYINYKPQKILLLKSVTPIIKETTTERFYTEEEFENIKKSIINYELRKIIDNHSVFRLSPRSDYYSEKFNLTEKIKIKRRLPLIKLYYNSECEQLVQNLYSDIKQICKEHEKTFAFYPQEPIELLLYNSHLDFEQNNTIPGLIPEGTGGFTLIYNEKVVLPYNGDYGQLLKVIKHELTHAFHLKKTEYVLEQNKSRMVIPSSYRKASKLRPPTFFAEGLACYSADNFPVQRNIILTDAVIENKLLTWDQLHNAYSWYGNYIYGREFIEYLANTYGIRKVISLIDNWYRMLPRRSKLSEKKIKQIESDVFKDLYDTMPDNTISFKHYGSELDYREIDRLYIYFNPLLLKNKFKKVKSISKIQPATNGFTIQINFTDRSCTETFLSMEEWNLLRNIIYRDRLYNKLNKTDGKQEDRQRKYSGKINWQQFYEECDLDVYDVDSVPLKEVKKKILKDLYTVDKGSSIINFTEFGRRFYYDEITSIGWVLPERQKFQYLEVKKENNKYIINVHYSKSQLTRTKTVIYSKELSNTEFSNFLNHLIAYRLRANFERGKIYDLTFEELLSYVFHEKINDIQTNFLNYIRTKYMKRFIYKSKITDEFKTLTPSSWTSFRPVSNGRQLLYFTYRNREYFEVCLKDIESQYQKILLRDNTPKFESFHVNDNKPDLKNNLIVMSIQNKESDILFVTEYKITPAGLIEYRESKSKTFRFPNILTIRHPKFSENGLSVLFDGLDENGKQDIYKYNLLSSKLTKITDDYYSDINPVEKDGKIYFSSNRNNKRNYGIYAYDSGKIDMLTSGDFNDIKLEFRPDRNELFFLRKKDGDIQLYSYDTVKKNINKITNLATGVSDYTFLNSDDLACQIFHKMKTGIYDIDLSSLEERIPQTTASPPIKPWWSADTAVKTNRYIPQFKLSNVYPGLLFEHTDITGNYGFIHQFNFNSGDNVRSYEIMSAYFNREKRIQRTIGLFYNYIKFKPSGLYNSDYYDVDIYKLEEKGIFIDLKYPLNKYNAVGSIFYLRKRIEYEESSYSQLLPREDLLNVNEYQFENNLYYIYDDATWRSVGPIEGNTLILMMKNTYNKNSKKDNEHLIIIDWRKYFRVKEKISHAIRLTTGRYFSEHSGYFLVGGRFGIRGYDEFELRGDHYFLFSNELRYVLFDNLSFKSMFSKKHINITNINSLLFVDAGNAWYSDEKFKLKGSLGWGLRYNFYGIVLKWDFIKQTNFKDVLDDLKHRDYRIKFSIGYNW